MDLAQTECFRDDLASLVPHMRAFARTLCREPAAADDLAQDALLKAWGSREQFTPGTNLKAWVFMIVRNQFYSDKRRSWRQQQLDQSTAEGTLMAADNPAATLELDDLRRALNELPDDQREAIILVGAGGLPYEEVAQITGCAVGTVKSRVSRARGRLQRILEEGAQGRDTVPPSRALGAIMGDLARLKARA